MTDRYQLAIFDFDGTLADSFPWFLQHMNAIADRFGFRRVPAGEIDAFRGMEAREIIRTLEVPTWKLPLIAQHMRRLKAQHRGQIGLFPGVDRMLRALKAHGLTLALVSSDAEASVRATLGADNAAQIDVYACGASMFGKPAKFRAVLRQTGVTKAATIAIGDEMRDADAAAQAGIDFGAVAWGYAAVAALETKRPAVVFRKLEEIAERLASGRGAG
jgi:phosphoglycolate phosphatase